MLIVFCRLLKINDFFFIELAESALENAVFMRVLKVCVREKEGAMGKKEEKEIWV